MVDVTSHLSTSDLTAISHQEFLSDIIDEGFSDNSDDDVIMTSRIPQRFRPSPSSSINGFHDDQSTGDAMSTTTLAGSLFWKDRRLSGPSVCSLQGASSTAMSSRKSSDGTVKTPPTSAARRSSSIVRQMAFSLDNVDAADNVFKKKSFSSQRACSEPLNRTNSSAVFDDVRKGFLSLDIFDEISDISENDDTGSSSVSDAAASAVYGVDDVMGLRNQLEMIVRLSKTNIPVHFWPHLKTETIRPSSRTQSEF